VACEELQADHCSGAGAEDGRGLVAQVLDQAPGIIGVSLEAMIVVLWPVEVAAGKAASVVGDYGVVRGQVFGHPLKTPASPLAPGTMSMSRPLPQVS
jgi:hypothetical protein